MDTSVSPRFVVAAGKAAWPMYEAAAEAIQVVKGVVAAPSSRARRIGDTVEAFDAGHPAPNEASVAAGSRSLSLATESVANGGLLVLLSGGASALLVAPVSGVTLDDKVETARLLMAAGAPIHELNCVRKHLSRIKGGQLAAAARRTITLALSDVHGPVADDPSVIASGPTIADESTFSDALQVIRNRAVAVPARVAACLERGVRGEVSETVKPGDPRILESTYHVIGNRHTAAAGASRAAERRGYQVVPLIEATLGEARVAAEDFVSRAMAVAHSDKGPLCVIASGETTVTVRGGGLGGRNQEFALSAAPLLRTISRSAVLGSAGTDGIDGPTDAAGAVVDTTSLARALERGLDWDLALARNDAYHFFEPLSDLILWGPTGTNVGDLHVLLIG
jgi:glycerate 2-kinase